MRTQPKKIGLAIVGAGRVGLIRGEVAARHPEVEWSGIAEKNPERAKLVGDKVGAESIITSSAFINRRTGNPAEISPMAISGTHTLDIDASRTRKLEDERTVILQ